MVVLVAHEITIQSSINSWPSVANTIEMKNNIEIEFKSNTSIVARRRYQWSKGISFE